MMLCGLKQARLLLQADGSGLGHAQWSDISQQIGIRSSRICRTPTFGVG
jgi:hypothetical protein